MSQQSAPSTIIVAHRGASHDAPENTLASFRLAWEQRADGVEGDFHLSQDGHVICMHDPTTQRTSEVGLEIAKSTLTELKQLDVGRWKHSRYSGERIPTLQEVIATVPGGKRIVIELKVGAEIVAPMARILNGSNLRPEQILVIGFDEETVIESKRLLPHIKTHWLSRYDPEGDVGPWKPTAASIAETITRTGADGLGSQARRSVLTTNFVRELKAGGVSEFHVWTVDDPADFRYYQSLEACFINTNQPAFIRRELGKQPARR